MPCETAITVSRILFGLLLVLPPHLSAQSTDSGSSTKPAEPTLNSILLHLQRNLDTYRASIPNFFCDEHLVSNMYVRSRRYLHTTTDSIFRLKRSDSKNSNGLFLESRQIKTVDKRPAQDQTLTGPAIFSGAFSNALRTVSLEFQSCYDYKLILHKRLHGLAVVVVDYRLKESMRSNMNCPGPETNYGRAFVDPQTMRIVRLEQETPHHEINSGVYGPWRWSIDYAQVILNNKTFWMPKKITSKASSPAVATDWLFTATYRNYHELTVTSRILPGVNYDPKQ